MDAEQRMDQEDRELWKAAAVAALGVLVTRQGAPFNDSQAQNFAYSAGNAADCLLREFRTRFAGPSSPDFPGRIHLSEQDRDTLRRADPNYLPEALDWRQAAEEPLAVIEVNECPANPGSLVTARFRRCFNVIRKLQKELRARER